jgi:Domain of unknown function (DUF4272)
VSGRRYYEVEGDFSTTIAQLALNCLVCSVNSEIPAEEAPTPPTPDRVAARAIVLSAVACRALIEKDAEKTGAEQLRRDVVEWLNRVGVSDEMEPSEAALLSTPLGKLDKKTTMDATWSSEGMVVLAWVLGCVSLPAFYAECEPSDVANAMGFLGERDTTVLRRPRLRDSSEIAVSEETYLTLHWRLRQFSIEPGTMDLAAYVSSCNWGPLRLDQLELCEGDLAVEGVRIDRLDYPVFRRTLSIVQERHRAFNWLIGWDSVYSQVTTDT